MEALQPFKSMKTTTLIILALVTLPAAAQNLSSGPDIGDGCHAFDPYHVSGPDRNTTTCPMCKYGARSQGVMIWLNDADWKSIEPILLRMESEVKSRGLREFRVFVMYMNPNGLSKADLIKEAQAKAKELKLDKVALTCIPSASDPESAAHYRINPDKAVKNTVMVYSKRRVVHKVINLEATGLNELMKTCDDLYSRNPL
jgi:protocatechuate 3,4-dioxygenase beta subunit